MASETEDQKLPFEFFKHIVTLDTAAIIFLFTLMDKGFVKQSPLGLPAFAFYFFTVSLVHSTTLMLLIAFPQYRLPGKPAKIASSVIFAGSLLGFAAGLISLIILAITATA